MNTILNNLSEADKNKSFLTIYKDGADFDIKLSDFTSAISAGSLKLLNGINLSASLTEVTDVIGTISPLQLSTEQVGLSRTVNLSAGATTPRLFNVAYTINNSGAQTGTLTGIFLNATETALNGITHNLMDLQVGGVSRVKVLNSGVINAVSLIATGDIVAGLSSYMGFTAKSLFSSPSDGVMLLTNNAVTSFNRIQLGGTTSSFPAIQRNTTSISFRLADDSGYCNARLKQLRFENASVINDVNDGTITLSNNAQNDFNRLQLGGTTNLFPAIKRNGAQIDFRLADDSNYAALNTGATFIKGSGTTSATTSLLVQNSAGTSLLTVRDDGVLTANANNCVLGSISSTNITLNSGQSDFNAFAAFNNNSGSPSLRIFNDNASVSIGIGTATRIASAALFIDSTTKGFLMPRMTTAQKNAIVTPATGLMVFDTDLGKLCVFSTTWQTVTSV